LPHLKLNEANVYCGSYLPAWRPGVDYRSVYSAHPEQGGGVHLDLIHEIDYSYWLFGPPLSVNSFIRCKSTINIEAADYGNYLLEYDTFAVNIILNYYRLDKKRTLELVCSDDTYLVDLYANSVTSTKGIIFQSDQDILSTYIMQMKYFISAIKDSSETMIMNNINEAYNVLKICLKK
jgi:predicted dehydrogenase